MAFVTWNIAPVREIPGINPLFPDLAPTDLVKKPRTKDAKGAENPEEHPRGQFQHAGEGGWFFIASVGSYSKSIEAKTLVDHSKDGKSEVFWDESIPGFDYIGAITSAKEISEKVPVERIRLLKPDDEKKRVGFSLHFPRTYTRQLELAWLKAALRTTALSENLHTTAGIGLVEGGSPHKIRVLRHPCLETESQGWHGIVCPRNGNRGSTQ